jgi:hypothetical protein
MRKRVAMIAGLGLLAAVSASPVAANGASVDRVGAFETVLAVKVDADFPLGSLMRADCTSLIRIERPDGSAVEIQDCQLSDRPVMIPAFQGTAPTEAFVHEAGPCQWHSDYWFSVTGEDVLASHVQYTVTPSGHVHARSEYPAEPLICE